MTRADRMLKKEDFVFYKDWGTSLEYRRDDGCANVDNDAYYEEITFSKYGGWWKPHTGFSEQMGVMIFDDLNRAIQAKVRELKKSG
jgi:hypothetical protein